MTTAQSTTAASGSLLPTVVDPAYSQLAAAADSLIFVGTRVTAYIDTLKLLGPRAAA